MKKSVEKEIKKLIKILKLNCSIKEFQNKVNWNLISARQKLSNSNLFISEDFIIEFHDKEGWNVLPNADKIKELIKLEEQKEEKREKREKLERDKLEKCKLLRQKEYSKNSIMSLEV